MNYIVLVDIGFNMFFNLNVLFDEGVVMMVFLENVLVNK